MYPTYVRGLSYLALHKPTEAAAEFQKILDHPGVVLGDPMGAVARLQLGRALTQAGEVGKAKLAYQDLLALWKDADADLDLPKQQRPNSQHSGDVPRRPENTRQTCRSASVG
jgi:lipopolysaccharide biosynthesis regulator YciM